MMTTRCCQESSLKAAAVGHVKLSFPCWACSMPRMDASACHLHRSSKLWGWKSTLRTFRMAVCAWAMLRAEKKNFMRSPRIS